MECKRIALVRNTHSIAWPRTPQKCLPMPCQHVSWCYFIFFRCIVSDYQLYFVVPCECPFSIQTIQCPNTFGVCDIVMPTCLIYCCTHIPKTANIPYYIHHHERTMSTLDCTFYSLTLSQLHCHLRHFLSGLVLVRASFPHSTIPYSCRTLHKWSTTNCSSTTSMFILLFLTLVVCIYCLPILFFLFFVLLRIFIVLYSWLLLLFIYLSSLNSH